MLLFFFLRVPLLGLEELLRICDVVVVEAEEHMLAHPCV
jgi:hypothetical protein